jgi:hypothetical protein
MKKTLTFGALLLSCCLAAVAQVGSTPNQTPQGSTPTTFPQDQTGQTPGNPTTPADPSAIPPDTNAPGQMSHDHANQASNSQATTLRGCLSQSSDGSFVLADNSGNNFQLRGATSRLSSYVGKQVRVEGVTAGDSGTGLGAMSSPSSSTGSSSASDTSSGTAASARQFNVTDVHKLADACSMGSGRTTK